MSRFLAVSLFAAIVTGPSAVVAMHNPNISNAEFKCQGAAGKAESKYLRGVLKCAGKCYTGYAHGLNPGSDCFPPYGGATATCAASSGTNGTKMQQSIAKACDPTVTSSADCPECYDAAVGGLGCTSFASDQAMFLSNYDDVLVAAFLCKTASASTLEQKCQLNAMKAGAKFLGSIYKCFGKCFSSAHAGIGTAADCAPNPVLPNDPTTATCLSTAELKTHAAIDKKCVDAGVNLQCPLACSGNANCDSAPFSGDGICTDHNCTAGNTSTSPYPTSSYLSLLIVNSAVSNIVDGGLAPDSGIYCSQ